MVSTLHNCQISGLEQGCLFLVICCITVQTAYCKGIVRSMEYRKKMELCYFLPQCTYCTVMMGGWWWGVTADGGFFFLPPQMCGKTKTEQKNSGIFFFSKSKVRHSLFRILARFSVTQPLAPLYTAAMSNVRFILLQR